MRNSIKIIVALMLVACMLVACGSGSSSGSKSSKKAEKAASSYKDAIAKLEDLLNGDADTLKGLAPDEYWTWLEDLYDENDVEFDMDGIKEYFEDEREEGIDDAEDEYGDNIQYTLEIEDEEEVDEDDLELIAEFLESQYDIDADDVTQAYELEINRIVKGDDDEDDESADMFVVKIGKSWYPVMVQDYDDQVVVQFIIHEFSSGYMWSETEEGADEDNVAVALPEDYQ